MTKVLLIFVLGHLIADFWLQTNRILIEKQKRKGMLRHSIHHFVAYLFLLLVFGELDLATIVSAILIAIVHFGIDTGKIKWEQTMGDVQPDRIWKNKTFRFLTDQAVHLLSIHLVLLLFGKSSPLSRMVSLFEERSLTPEPAATLDIRILVILVVLVGLTHGSAYLIQSILSDLKTIHPPSEQAAATAERAADSSLHEIHETLESLYQNRSFDLEVENTVEKQEEDSLGNKIITTVTYSYQSFEPSQTSAGKYIGMLERLLIAILVVKSAYTGIAFIGAMKTLTRFKQFDEKGFAEYYLLGTFLSVLMGFAGGFLLSMVL